MLSKNYNLFKSVWVRLLVRSLLIGQLIIFAALTFDAISDIFINSTLFSNGEAIIDGCSCLINETYIIVYLSSIYCIYQILSFVILTAHDSDVIFIAPTAYLLSLFKRFVHLKELSTSSKSLYQVISRNQLHVKTNSFACSHAETEYSYLPFI